jgi:hypothetical protein
VTAGVGILQFKIRNRRNIFADRRERTKDRRKFIERITLRCPTNPSRRTGLAAVLAQAVAAGIIASNNGSASVAPTPRRNVRRGINFFVMIMTTSSNWARAS